MMHSKEKGWVNSHFLSREHTGQGTKWRVSFICVAHPDVRFAAVRFCFWAVRFREREEHLWPDRQGICEKRGGRISVSTVLILFRKWVLDVKGFANLTSALQILELKSFPWQTAIHILNQGRVCETRFILVKRLLHASKDAARQGWAVGEKLGRWGQDCSGSGVSARVSHLCWVWAEAPAPLGLEVAGKVTFYFLF